MSQYHLPFKPDFAMLTIVSHDYRLDPKIPNATISLHIDSISTPVGLVADGEFSDPKLGTLPAMAELFLADWAGTVHCSLRFFPLHTWAASDEQNIMAKIDLQTPVS